MRTLVLWCPDWPVTAAGYGVDDPVVVMDGLVVAASKMARDCGVRLGMRQREAERQCPEAIVVKRDETQEVQQFEPVFAAISDISPSLEIIRPGLCALNPRGPARYFGGEAALCVHLASVVQRVIEQHTAPEIGVGIADGFFAATLAAHRQCLVPRGKTKAFLSPLPITALENRALTDVLLLLGVTTLGEFAALPQEMVGARFGSDGARAHQKAGGEEQTALQPTALPKDFDVRVELEQPVDRVDVALFAARASAALFIEELGEHGLSCSRLSIAVETEHAESLSRQWRAEYVFDADSLIQRLRWQLDGWLSGTTIEPSPTAGITLIRFHPEEVVASSGQQTHLFGGKTDSDRRAVAAADRLAGLLGNDAVLTGLVGGGRSPGERSVMVPWGAVSPVVTDAPWPGRHPLPAPSVIHPKPVAAVVRDAQGGLVVVSARGRISLPPALIEIGSVRHAVTAWSGPWLSDERFWDKAARQRRARFQFLFDDGTAHLCFVERAQWFVEATYD